MQVQDRMKTEVASISIEATIGEAADLMVERHIGTLPVVDALGRLVGVIQLRDLHALVMPDFVRLMEDFDFVHDFGAVNTRDPIPEVLRRPVSAVMTPPVSVEATCGLMRAAAMLHSHRMLDMPVVDKENHLVGIASRVDIGTAMIEHWGKPKGE